MKLFEGPDVRWQGGSGIRSTLNGKGPSVGLDGLVYDFKLMCNFDPNGPTPAPRPTPAPPPAPPGCFQDNIDYEGCDLQWPSPWSAPTAEGCQGWCEQESGCQIFTWRPSDDACFLKRAGCAVVPKDDRVSGPKTGCDDSPAPTPPVPTPPTPIPA